MVLGQMGRERSRSCKQNLRLTIVTAFVVKLVGRCQYTFWFSTLIAFLQSHRTSLWCILWWKWSLLDTSPSYNVAHHETDSSRDLSTSRSFDDHWFSSDTHTFSCCSSHTCWSRGKMRLWSIHPSYLDKQGLLGCWCETLLAQKVLMGQTRGYKNHPQLVRWSGCSNAKPLIALGLYLHMLYIEGISRGFNLNVDKILMKPKITCMSEVKPILEVGKAVGRPPLSLND